MNQRSAGAARRVPRSRLARRSLILAALGAGLWLTGEATASAQELPPPLTVPSATSPDVDEAVAPAELPAPALSAGVPGGSLAGSAVAPAVAPATAAVAPVVRAAAPVVHSATVPVADLTEPVVHSAEPVLDHVAPLRDVVVDAADSLAGALDPLLAPAVDVLAPAPGADPIRSQEPPDPGHRLTGGVHIGAGYPGRAAHRVPPADAVVLLAAGPDAAAGRTVPVRPPTSGTGPVPHRCTGAQSFDQSPADLPAAAEATITAALVAAGNARDAAGDRVSDPCFSPD